MTRAATALSLEFVQERPSFDRRRIWRMGGAFVLLTVLMYAGATLQGRGASQTVLLTIVGVIGLCAVYIGWQMIALFLAAARAAIGVAQGEQLAAGPVTLTLLDAMLTIDSAGGSQRIPFPAVAAVRRLPDVAHIRLDDGSGFRIPRRAVRRGDFDAFFAALAEEIPG